MSRLVIFLLFYFSIYGCAHLYLLIKARRAFYLDGVQYVLLFAIFTFLLLAPINARLLEAQGHWLLSILLAWIGFIWMGFVFIYTCLALPLDSYHLLVSTGQQLLSADWTSIMLSKRESIGLVSLITCLVMAYGVFEAYQIRAETVTIQSSKISVKAGPIRIVMISDVHIGPMFYPGRLPPMIKMIDKARPDILISGGDLVDGYIYNETEMAAALKYIPAPLGKFAVIGNHEVYEGLLRSIKFTRDAGFTLLRNQSVTVRKDLVITGVDDSAKKRDEASSDEDILLGSVPRNKFSLLLKHRPHVDKENLEQIDLQLSGHTHRGQIFPFGWVLRLSYPLGHGLRQIAPGRHIYISRGTGTWGPPIRVLAPPEITIIDLIPAKGKAKVPGQKPG